MRRKHFALATLCTIAPWAALPAAAAAFSFSTGNPDGRIATLSRTDGAGGPEVETADDFILSQRTIIDRASFTGLIPTGSSASSVSRVQVELYKIFPGDSANPPSGRVPTRVNSPADNEFAGRDTRDGDLTFTMTVLAPSFTAANSILNGINPVPNQLTGGEGPVTGQLVRFDVAFTTPFDLEADHNFFRPEVGLTDGNFLWLSAAKPIESPGTPFVDDLQTWMRGPDISPDWERPGTEITGAAPFNAAFSLSGTTDVPEPASLVLFGTMLTGLGLVRRMTRIIKCSEVVT